MAPETASKSAPKIAGCSRSNAAQNWVSSWRGLIAAPRATLVTLECTHVDIAMSVIGEGGGVYSPAVLRPGDQPTTRTYLEVTAAVSMKC